MKSYKVLVVDDVHVIHLATELLLAEMDFVDFNIELLQAYSAKEAKMILDEHQDIALALIDVNMETPTAGLDLVEHIRNKLKNKLIRLVIRASRNNEYPEMKVVLRYDINDFLDKAKLSRERLFTSIRTSIKQYKQLVKLEAKYNDVYEQFTTNSITRLPNQIKFYEDSVDEADKTLILIDIVSFSAVNEIGGRDAGDYVLKKVGEFLYDKYNDYFNVYHLHSDVFALINNGEFSDNIFNTVEKIKDDVSKLHITTNNFNQTLDTTIGVSHNGGKNLIRKAEFALKEAINDGKNQIKYYSEDLNIIRSINEVKEWAPKLKKALTDGSLKAYYQPIYNLKTNEIDKFELLMRLESDGEIHSPYKFLHAAKESGQLYDVFKYMFKKACIKVSETEFNFSVNIGDYELRNDNLVEYIVDTMSAYDVNPKQLSLEILEYNYIGNDNKTLEAISKIHDLGIEIIVDDFGVESSNFGQIERLPINVIKIDGSFIKDLATSLDSQIIVKTIKAFAKEKNIKLVAEFVCNKEVYEMVKKYDIDFAQGYYLGKPSIDIDDIQRDLD